MKMLRCLKNHPTAVLSSDKRKYLRRDSCLRCKHARGERLVLGTPNAMALLELLTDPKAFYDILD